MINLDIPYEQIEKTGSRYTKLEKAVLAVSAVAIVGLVGAVCLGGFSAPSQLQSTLTGVNVRTPTMVTSFAPKMSSRQVTRSMDNMAVRAQNFANSADGLKKNNDGRLGKIGLLAVPVLAWVGFNILGPAQNQLSDMSGKAGVQKPKGPSKVARRRGVRNIFLLCVGLVFVCVSVQV